MKPILNCLMLMALISFASGVMAQDIVSFQDGYLTFTNADPELFYRIEYRPNLTGDESWDGSYEAVRNIHTNDATLSVPVGVFYRVVGSTLPTPTVLIQKTGQTNVFYVGDDGDTQNGEPSPSPRFTDHEDGTVSDHQTGLMWTKNADPPGASRKWSGALDYCAAMNSGPGTYGYTDWRLPNLRELESLLDYGQYGPALPSDHPFTNVRVDSYYYWSSTTHTINTGYAWFVGLAAGNVGSVIKSGNYYVWPVRDGP